MPMTKTDGLVEAFKETVQSRIEAGEIEEIDDETLGKLQECLRYAIRASSRINQQTRGVPLSDSSPNLQPPPVPASFTIGNTRTTNFPLSNSSPNLQPPPVPTSFTIDNGTTNFPLSNSSPNLQPPPVPTSFTIDNGTTNFPLSNSSPNLQPPPVPASFTIDNWTTNISPPSRTPSIFTSLPVQHTSIGHSAPLQSNGRNESFSDYMISRLS
jgi:hypothetical protein